MIYKKNFCLFVCVFGFFIVACHALAAAIPRKHKISIVTGANGYVGREVVKALWDHDTDEKKYTTIFCLVRPARVESETKFWGQLSASSKCIKVLPYDMADGGETMTRALEIALQQDDTSELEGEVCVYHIASVFGPSGDPVQSAKENVQGTKDLVQALGNFPNKCRLVLTSSMAAVRGSGQEPLNGRYYTHQDWNTLSKLDEKNWGSCYQWSKAESERVAWDMAKELNLPMTSICPSFVFGPPTELIPGEGGFKLSNSYSITLVGQWVRGDSPVQSRLFVDIRDVAKAHVAAGNLNRAVGERFIVSTEARVSSEEIAKTLETVCKETGLGDPAAISFDCKFQGGAIPLEAGKWKQLLD